MKSKIFLGIETVLYISFLWMDLFELSNSNGSSFMKFLSIVLCLFYLFLIKKENSKEEDLLLMRVALTFTVLADLFILILEIYEPGLICFIVVQICYLIRVRYHKPRKWSRNLIAFFIALAICRVLRVSFDLLLVLTCFYSISIVRNVIETIVHYLESCHQSDRLTSTTLSKKQSKLFMLGMILFLLCDINVGINNMASYVVVNGATYQNLFQFASIAMWLFYLPSQVLLVLSANEKKI